MRMNLKMFQKNEIWAYPTDTSFGLGVRADDVETLEKLKKLKKRSSEKYFSLMVKNFEMLKEFAEVPETLKESDFFSSPLTVLLRPKYTKLPKTIFWPLNKVAFRVATLPHIIEQVNYPITATSANISGENPIFEISELKNIFSKNIKIDKTILKLSEKNPSTILDYTENPVKKIR